MNKKQLISGLMAGALTLALAAPMAAPVRAAGTSSFVDVLDSNTAVNADILRLMGVSAAPAATSLTPAAN